VVTAISEADDPKSAATNLVKAWNLYSTVGHKVLSEKQIKI